ncbi:MAG: hypothetical protein ACRDKG_08355 [Actinomycetota bacterium]
MAKHLQIGNEHYTLPEDADVEKVRGQLADAMEDEKVVRIQVAVSKTQIADLLVNGEELVTALVWEDSSSGAGFSIVD